MLSDEFFFDFLVVVKSVYDEIICFVILVLKGSGINIFFSEDELVICYRIVDLLVSDDSLGF